VLFDVQEILKKDGGRIQLNIKLIPPAEFQMDDVIFGQGVSVSGELENVGGVLELKASVQGSFTVPCGRCMKITEQRFSLLVQETLANEHAEVANRDVVIPFTGTSIDLGGIIWPEIFLALDTKYLCSPDCKGLCMHCGADLNQVSCDCKEDDIDPRMAGLAKLLQ